MTDNVTADAGAGGAVFATDDVAGVHYPITKLAYGALDSATIVTTGAAGLPIQDGGNAITVDWAGTAPPIGAGTEAAALRVTLATDSTGVVSVDDNGGILTVDGTVILGAGTAEIGKLAAGVANIGDVDVLTIAAGDNNIGNVDIVSLPASTNTLEVVGDVAHDAAIAGNPLTIGGVASAAAPTAVSADQDAVRAWFLLNGAQATVLTAAGALIGGDAANGLDVDVIRLPALVAGDNNIGNVDIVSGTVTTVSTVTNLSQQGGVAISLNTGVRDTGTQRVTIATNDVVPVTDNGGSLTVDIGAGETHIGELGGNTVVKTITMTADTAIMAAADIIATTQQLDAAFRIADGTGVLQSVTVFDYDDNAAFAFDVYIHSTSTSMGTENAGISITDANASAGILGVISFATGDAKDLINGRMYHKSNIGLPIYAVTGTDDLYVSVVNGSGTPTFAGGSIPIRLGILRD